MRANHAGTLIRFLFSLFIASAALAAPVKLAIIETSPSVAEPSALLTAALSKNEAIALVERSALENILREQSIAANQVTNILRAGQLLGADGILVLDGTNSQTAMHLNLRLVAVKEGAVLHAIQAVVERPILERWIQTVAPQMATVALKIAADRSSVIPISVLNLRSPSASAASTLLDRELTSLLLHRLSLETNLLVLERRKLLDLALEKDLAGRTEQFLAGAYLLDGIVNKDGFNPDKVTLSVRLIAPDKSITPIEVAGARTNLTALIDDLAARSFKSLKLTKSAAWDPAREARELADEAAWNLRWRMFPEAQAAGDSAWALGLRDPSVSVSRALAYSRDHYEMLFGGGEGVIVTVERAPSRLRFDSVYQGAAILEELITRDPNSLTNTDVLSAVHAILRTSGELLESYYYLVEAREGLEDQLADLRRLCRNIESKSRSHPAVRKPFWQGEALGTNLPLLRTNLAHVSLKYASMFHEKPEDLLETYRDLFSAESFPYIRQHSIQRFTTAPLFGGWKWEDRSRAESVQDAFIGELIASTNIFLNLEGRLLQLYYEHDWSPQQQKRLDDLLAFLDKHWDLIKARRWAPAIFTSPNFYIHAPGSYDNYRAPTEQANGWMAAHTRSETNTIARPPTMLRPNNPQALVLRSPPLTATNFWALPSSASAKDKQFFDYPLFSENKLWFWVWDSRMFDPNKSPVFDIYSVNLENGNQQSFPTEKPLFSRGARVPLMNPGDLQTHQFFEVRSNILYSVNESQLRRLDLNTGQKSLQSLPENRVLIHKVAQNLYLSGANSIYKIEDDGTLRLLGSTRRRPALSAIDELGYLGYPFFTQGLGDKPRAVINNNVYLFDGQSWNLEFELNTAYRTGTERYLFFITDLTMPASQRALQMHVLTKTDVAPRFLAAAVFPRRDPKLLEGGTNEWILTFDQMRSGSPLFVGSSPALYVAQDTADAPIDRRLLVFPVGGERCIEIPILFQPPEVPRAKTSARSFGVEGTMALDTPFGVVIRNPQGDGFALVPISHIEEAISNASPKDTVKTPSATAKLP